MRAARTAVAWVFAANGFAFAGWASRLPALRDAFGLSPARVGLVLLAVSAGAFAALPLAGAIVHRAGTAPTVLTCGAVGCAGLALVGLSTTITGVAVGFAAFGAANGVWDVGMNVEGTEVERRLGRAILPRFHAGWSLGTVAGAVAGSLAARAGVPLRVHLPVVAALVMLVVALATRHFLPPAASVRAGHRPGRRPGSGSLAAWSEPRTLALGALVLCFAFAEGSANDWLTLGLVDGYGLAHAAAAAGFAAFVTAMMLGRMTGPWVLDRFGRVTVLRSGACLAGLGIVLFVAGSGSAPVAEASIGEAGPGGHTGHGMATAIAALATVCWGLGASLGFPVGLSAAADERARAPARVGVVATIGYTAFLAGPPLLGRLADQVGVVQALAAVLVPVGIAVAIAGVARPIRPVTDTPEQAVPPGDG